MSNKHISPSTVIAREEITTLPTYLVGQPDQTPPIGRLWGYWRIYPYPMLDELTDQREDVDYRALVIENEYLKLTVLPEIGGHLYAYDKIANQDVFYRPSVIKPALIALRGAWIAGGIEFNFPVSHNPLTFAPVDSSLQENPDGSATITIGAYEQLTRMRWSVDITLRPGIARIDTTIRVENRTSLPHRYYFWSNSSERVTEGTRFVSPVTSVHGWRGTMRYPVHEGEYVPAYRNHHVACDLFSRNVRADFFGCYDDDTNEGIVNIADHHQVTGRKYFTWGNSHDGLVWEHFLSDSEGPYIELQSGPFETQSVFRLLAPHQVNRWSECWYPVRDIGGFEFANEDVAVNLTKNEQGSAIGIHSTRQIVDATITADVNGSSVGSWDADLAPDEPAIYPLDSDPGDTPVHVIITSPTDHVIADCVIPWKAEEDDLSDPPLVSESEQDTAHGLYARGMHAEEQNLLPDARALYEQAIERDPLAVLPLTRLGILQIKSGEYEEAITLLERAARVAPTSAEIHYYRGVALRNLPDRLNDAEQAFWQTRFDLYYFAVGRHQLGEIAANRGDFETALGHFVAASESLALETPAWTARVTMLRCLERHDEAASLIDRILERDRLNLVTACERALVAECRNDSADNEWSEFGALVHDESQTLIELSTYYSNFGLWQTALSVLDRIREKSGAALIEYHRAYLFDKLGETEKAVEARRRARTASVDAVFPHRNEEITILRESIDADPTDATAPYLLGTLLYAIGRTDDGRAMWREASRRGSRDASLYSVLGWAAWKLDSDRPQALSHYRKAAELRQNDYRIHMSIDQIEEELGTSPEKRLETLLALPKSIRSSGRLPQRLVQVYTATSRWGDAKQVFSSHFFRPWEGERTMRGIYTDFCVAHGEALMDKQRWADAREVFERALEYPLNIGVGKPYRPTDSPFYYRAGFAASAAGDDEAARDHWQRGATEEHTDAATVPRLYSALCRKKLGDEAANTTFEEIRNVLQGKTQRTADEDTALGIAEQALGNGVAARAAFSAALEKQPYHLLARRELKRLG